MLIGTSDAVRRKRITERLIPWGPTILESTLPPELEEELEQILGGPAARIDDTADVRQRTDVR